MGCQASVVLGDNLTFSICTHDADTGALTDTSAPPSYRVYEDETAAAILNGTMAKLDDANTLGFYTEQIACVGPAFEVGKSYTIYIEATVDGVTGGIAYAFTVGPVLNNLSAVAVNAEVVDALNTDTYAEPGQEAPGVTVSLARKINYLYKAWRNRKDNNGALTRLYADDEITVDQQQTTAEAAGTVTKTEWISGP